MPKNKIYKAAVIGCGYIGAGERYFDKNIQPATHAGAYDTHPRFELVALVDNDRKKLNEARKHFPEARLYNGVQDMIKKEKPDIVSVASPTSYHFKHVITLAKFGVPVILCEKPIADTSAQGKKMVEACKKSGSRLFINYQRHFDPLIQKWAKKIKSGALGRLYQGNVYYYNGLRNNAGHMVDLLNMFLGKPEEVIARFNKETETKEKGFNVDGMMRYKKNMLITLQSLSKNYGYFALELFGEKGMLSITKNTSPVIEFRKKIRNKEARLYFELSAPTIEGKPRSALMPTLNHIISCLDGKTLPMSGGESGLSVLSVLDALEASAKSNGKSVRIKK